MKKCNFYTMVYSQEKRGAVAEPKTGWCDETFNYYCTKYDNRRCTWYAIEKTTGLSVTTGNTLKEASQKANTPEMLAAIKNRITPEMINRFNDLVKETQNNDFKN